MLALRDAGADVSLPARASETDDAVAAGALAIPCVAVDDARSKRLFDNGVGTGQSCVVTVEHRRALRDGTIVAVAGGSAGGRPTRS